MVAQKCSNKLRLCMSREQRDHGPIGQWASKVRGTFWRGRVGELVTAFARDQMPRPACRPPTSTGHRRQGSGNQRMDSCRQRNTMRMIRLSTRRYRIAGGTPHKCPTSHARSRLEALQSPHSRSPTGTLYLAVPVEEIWLSRRNMRFRQLI